MTQPLAGYHFTVEWGGTRLGFTEVDGLEIENEVLEYREGSSPEPASMKLPGLRKYANLVLKRGVMLNDNEFFDWMQTVGNGAAEHRDMTISLLNEEHSPTVTWRVKGAWPVRLTGPKLDALQGRIAIETLEIAHEGLTVRVD